MKKWSICKLVVILILSIQNKADAQKLELIRTTTLQNFPSASSLEFYNGRLYVVGDDARELLVLDAEHKVIDSIKIFDVNAPRIDKDEKADLESSVILHKDNKSNLIAFGSLSAKNRNKALSLDLKTGKAKLHRFDLKNPALAETNIEGAALIGNQLLMSNRANNTNKHNYLILTRLDNDGIPEEKNKIIRIVLPKSKAVIGISGLTYVKEKDLLLFTASTENTNNSYTDGTIGDSYIGYITQISDKINEQTINTNRLINLKRILASRSPQKVESIVVEKATGDSLLIHLAADNDNGKSNLFKLKLTLQGL